LTNSGSDVVEDVIYAAGNMDTCLACHDLYRTDLGKLATSEA
jgi:hypothetical protein